MKKLFYLITFMISVGSVAQDFPSEGEKTVLTLDDCIRIALANNLDVKRAMNNLELAKSNKTQAYFNFLPTLNARWNYDLFQGPNFDPQTGKFVTETTKSSNPGFGSNVTLFNTFANHYFLNQRIQELNSAMNSTEAAKINIEAFVMASYLNVILDRENVKISMGRLELLQGQYEREQKREEIGVGNMETVLNFKAQAANERLNLVNLTNQYRSDLLILLQILQIPDVVNYTIADYEINESGLEIEIDPYTEVADDILGYSFDIKRAEANLKASELMLKQTKSNLYPNITASGQIGTRYSSNYLDLEDNEVDYLDQLSTRNFQTIGIALNVPIFNGLQQQNAVARAKVNYLNSELSNKQTLLDVNNGIQRNYLDLISAQSSYTTAIDTYDASNQTFEFVKKRFDAGNTDFYTYLESLNNKNQAEAQLVNAKYMMILRTKILDTYRGIGR